MAAPGKHRRREPIPDAAVYALCEPGSTTPTPDVVRYIGQTRHGISARDFRCPLTARWSGHLRRPAGPIRRWLESLDDDPAVLLLDDMSGADMIELTAREHDWIDEYRAKGAALLNTALRPSYAHGG